MRELRAGDYLLSPGRTCENHWHPPTPVPQVPSPERVLAPGFVDARWSHCRLTGTRCPAISNVTSSAKRDSPPTVSRPPRSSCCATPAFWLDTGAVYPYRNDRPMTLCFRPAEHGTTTSPCPPVPRAIPFGPRPAANSAASRRSHTRLTSAYGRISSGPSSDHCRRRSQSGRVPLSRLSGPGKIRN